MNSKEQLINLRKETGMNRKQFCEYFGIPYRTMTDWELGNRQMPEYLLRLMKYKVEMEKHMERSQQYIVLTSLTVYGYVKIIIDKSKVLPYY